MADGNGNGDMSAQVEQQEPEIRTAEELLRALDANILLGRQLFMRDHGMTFGGARDEYAVFGYDRTITTRQYRAEYARGGVAGRIVDAICNATWRGTVELREDEEDDKKKFTAFEQAWIDLDKRHQVQAKCNRVDKLSRLSEYAVLLIGADGALDTELPKGAPGKLLYLTPFLGSGGPGPSGNPYARTHAGDADATIHELELDTSSPRFGMPKTYRLKRVGPTGEQVSVHWTRVHHVAEGCLDDDIYGQPALERVWNLLADLRKVTAGGAEAFWLRANQGLHLNVAKDMQLDKDQFADVMAKLKEQKELYEHGMTRWLKTRGVDVNTLGSDVANFSNPADAILTQIAGATSIPKRILTGSEMGELASSQDRDNWKDQVNGRQTGYAGPYIIRPLVDRLIAYGYLPTPTKGPDAYEVRWPQIQTMTEQEKTAGAQAWAQVNATMGETVFTEAEIREKWADKEPLTKEQRDEIRERKLENIKMQQEAMAAQQPPKEEEDEDDDEAFPRAAEDREMLRVLEAAIREGNREVVDKIIGVGVPS